MKIPKRLAAVIASLIAVFGIGAVMSRLTLTRDLGMIDRPDQPPELSLKDWKQALIETKNALRDKNLSMISAGISYFASLAFFPTIAAAVAIAAFVMSPAQIRDVASGIEGYMPRDMASLVTTQLTSQASAEQASLIVAIIAITISLISASGAVDKVIKGLSIAYDTEETRGFIKLRLLSVGLIIGVIVIGILVLSLLAASPEVLVSFGVPVALAGSIVWLRWIILVIIISLVLSLLYRYGPNRPTAKWQWVSWGAAAATIIWLIATAAFFMYVQNFANFSESYSVFAGIIIMMIWFNISALIVLIGAQVNHRLETKTSASIWDRS